MATFRLIRFANPENFRAIQPAYLLELLRPYTEYFRNRGVELSTENYMELDYSALRDVLMNPDPNVPPKLVDDLYYINEMADNNGMDDLLGAIAALPNEKRVSLDLRSDSTPADVAVQVRLRAPELLERCHAARLLTRKRSFQYFQAKDGADFTFHSPDSSTIAKLEEALDDRLDQLNRGRNSKVFIYEKEDGVWLLIRHGRPCKREGTVTDKGSGTVYYRPEIYDVLRYDPQSGELSMNAETKKIGALHLEKIGLHLFGDAMFFPGTAKYELDPLIADGEQSLVCCDVNGMEWVKLREIQYTWGGPENEVEIYKADDVFASYRRQGRSLPDGRLTRANFLVKFTDSRSPRIVSIRPSNVASFTRDSDATLVEQWLMKRGFVMLPTPNFVKSPHGQPCGALAHP